MERQDVETIFLQEQRIKALELELYTLKLSLSKGYEHSQAHHDQYTTMTSCFQFPFHKQHAVTGPFQQVTYITKKLLATSLEPIEYALHNQVARYFDAIDEKLKG